MESDIASEIIREVLEVAPRKLSAIQAELLFIEGGTYIFHYQSGTVLSTNVCLQQLCGQLLPIHRLIRVG